MTDAIRDNRDEWLYLQEELRRKEQQLAAAQERIKVLEELLTAAERRSETAAEKCRDYRERIAALEAALARCLANEAELERDR